VALIVIPARYGSTRLPGKPLLPAAGRPIIVHVLARAWRASCADRVIVATDDQRIVDAVADAGGEAVLTREDHCSGTDRVAEAVADIEGDIVVNVQGDEPEIRPDHIDLLVRAIEEDDDIGMATIAAPIVGPEGSADAENPNVVKVVVDARGRALYFSREPIPHHREATTSPRLRHCGIYAYRRETLEALVRTEPTPLERSESLEQLRALETGHDIRVVVVDRVAPGIDTQEDYAAFLRRLETSRTEE
jgi:3-deoxy-manno-octulosonate cytidylyltransferase (CMP-KDO synthetase)